AGRDDREQHVDVGEIGRLPDDASARAGERLGLGAGAIPDRDRKARLEQALRHGKAHAADADPADLARVGHGLTPPRMWWARPYHSVPGPTIAPGRLKLRAALR